MIRVTVLYPNGNGTKFDIAYYTSKHMPMVKQKCGAACKSIAADFGLNAGEPGSKPPYLAIGYLTFDSVTAFRSPSDRTPRRFWPTFRTTRMRSQSFR